MSAPQPENRNPREVCGRFVKVATEALATTPEVAHEWTVSADGSHATLEITGHGAPGFDITIEAGPHEFLVAAEGFHEHLAVREPLEEFLGGITGLIRDMLSPNMRVREKLSGGKPYSWSLEVLMDGRWVAESTCGLIFWNWFGRRSEKIYSNTNLPPRPQMLEEGEE